MRPNDIDNAKIEHEYEYHLNRGKRTKQEKLRKALNRKCFYCGSGILFKSNVDNVPVCDSCYHKEKERLYLNENMESENRCACGGVKSFESEFCKECI